MNENLTIRETVMNGLLKTGIKEVHVEDINEVVDECISRCVNIKLEPHRTRRCWVIVSIIKK